MALPLVAAGVGSALGGLLGGALGGGGPEPKFRAAKMNEAGTLNLEALQKRAERPEEAFAAEANQGLEQAGDPMLAQTEAQDARDASMGGDGQFMGDALRERTNKRYASDVTNLKRQGAIDAFDRKRQAEKTSYGLGLQKQQIELEAAAKQKLFEREMDAARNSVLSSVLGSAGSFIGQGIAQMGGKPAAPTGVAGSGTSTGNMMGKES